MKYRKLYADIQPYFHHKNAIVVTGMRQVGKTTLLRQIFDSLETDSKLWFDLDNPLDQLIFEHTDFRSIHANLKRLTKGDRLYVFIDEIQNYPKITSVIKYLIDHFGVKFFLTGSSSFYLRNLFPESLSGRKFLFQLSTLSFSELLYFHDRITYDELIHHPPLLSLSTADLHAYHSLDNEFREFLEYGGFPEVVTTESPETKKLILKNIFTSFFEKDIRILSDYKDMRELRDLILLLVPKVGSLLDITRISSELGVQRGKLYHYLELLQGLFLLHLLPRYSKGIDRSVAGGKKVYFTDQGLLNYIGKVNESQLLENTVINQLKEYGRVSFFNYRNTAEIDAILDGKMAFEVKMTGTESDLTRLEKVARKLGLTEQFVISLNYRKNEWFLFPHFI